MYSLKKKYSFLLFLIFYHIRIYILSWLGLCLSDVLSTIIIFYASGGEIIPYSSPSNASSEDSFGLRVRPGGALARYSQSWLRILYENFELIC
ncbi:hypothetical protein LINPERHAP2_LOCUS44254 [Linum perenne]